MSENSDDSENRALSRSWAPPFATLLARPMARRRLLQGAAAATVASVIPPLGAKAGSSGFGVSHGVDDRLHLAGGYRWSVLAAWGDPVDRRAPPFDIDNQSARAQALQFGYNNDFIAFMPLPRLSAASDHGLLCVNHEYTNAELMFPGITRSNRLSRTTREQAAIETAAHGHSVIEIRRGSDGWQRVPSSRLNRRISAVTSPMRLSGPAAGNHRLKTPEDPLGRFVLGTLNNCAGGVTPWGTVLIAEENFNHYFSGDPANTPDEDLLRRYGIVGDPRYVWGRYSPRYDVSRVPNEPNRYGWVVEIDPYDPDTMPVKRTALGRFKHEGAACVVNRDGRIVVYSGDDQRFDYVYKFVSTNPMVPDDPAANRDLLDHGTLYVARFEAGGNVRWLPLIFGVGPLGPDYAFHNQADVLIGARRAADLLGATPMDRPEDIGIDPVTGRVYVMLTNNTRRSAGGVDAANPRGPNPHGHILELTPPGGARPDHGADHCAWTVFLLAGNPADPAAGARAHPETGADDWLTTPDNCAFDSRGRIWIATDGAEGTAGFADGLYMAETGGPARAWTRQFLRVPVGAELCGPAFTPDDRTLFVAVQHPGQGSSRDAPSTRWPDFDPAMPPRPAVIAIERTDGGPIGG